MRKSLLYPAVLCLATVRAGTYSIFEENANLFSSNTAMYRSGTSDFTSHTERWTKYEEPTYDMAIVPATEADVANIVRIARANNISVLATGGRHGTSVTLGQISGGVAIDLTQLNTVEIDASAGTVTVGGGARFSEIYDPIFNAGFQLLRLVTADGNITEASADSNPELYWGIRGAGVNFGIITSATYQLHEQVNGGQILSADFIFPAEMNGSYFDVLAALEGNMPAGLATISVMIYNSTSGLPSILANWVYAGSEEDGKEVIKPILALNPPVSSVSMVAWNELVTTAGFGLNAVTCQAGVLRSGYSANLKQLSAATYKDIFRKMDDFWAANPSNTGSTIDLEIFATQQMQAVSDDATAYPWRDAKANVLIGFESTDSSGLDTANAMAKEIRSDFQSTSGYGDLSVYPVLAPQYYDPTKPGPKNGWAKDHRTPPTQVT
ncbi:hypothetical protein DL764_005424 [Monosporascus ibericus]|uniref:FAD-binding PCMH-type domain-containing protein n=1 Tax=Monosporascus ibericus TaxID=155417 RepID=A0A4Q4T934_9PEZI|nr:hypothetical protein DL764_005424 [Monosporascus ibericus]